MLGHVATTTFQNSTAKQSKSPPAVSLLHRGVCSRPVDRQTDEMTINRRYDDEQITPITPAPSSIYFHIPTPSYRLFIVSIICLLLYRLLVVLPSVHRRIVRSSVRCRVVCLLSYCLFVVVPVAIVQGQTVVTR